MPYLFYVFLVMVEESSWRAVHNPQVLVMLLPIIYTLPSEIAFIASHYRALSCVVYMKNIK